MTTPATTKPGRHAARLVFYLGVLIALFAMHGPSSDHAMLMPGSAPSAATPSTATARDGMTSNGMTSNGMTSMDPRGAWVAVHHLSTGRGPLATGSPIGGMTHSDCVAAPRQHTAAGFPAPFVLAYGAANSPSAPAVLIGSDASDRAPPAPNLAALGIWRR